jgi:hypothetical protein
MASGVVSSRFGKSSGPPFRESAHRSRSHENARLDGTKEDTINLGEREEVKNGDFPKPLGESLAAYLQPKGEYYNAKKSFYQWAPGTKSQYSNVGVALGAFKPLGHHGYLDFPSGTLRVTI